MSEVTSASQQNVHGRLTVLKNRYRFLEQVYTYHSSVEDEVPVSGALSKSDAHSLLEESLCRAFRSALDQLATYVSLTIIPAGGVPCS